MNELTSGFSAVSVEELSQVEGGEGPLKPLFYAFFLAYYHLKDVALMLADFLPEPKPDPWR